MIAFLDANALIDLIEGEVAPAVPEVRHIDDAAQPQSGPSVARLRRHDLC